MRSDEAGDPMTERCWPASDEARRHDLGVPATVPQPWTTTRDVLAVVQMGAAWIATGVLHEARLPRLAAVLSAATVKLRPRATAERAATIERRLGDRLEGLASRHVYEDHLTRRYEHVLGRVLELHARGWDPQIELIGAQHLRAALAHGRGAILWGMSFCGSLVPKMGLSRGGFPIAHLSTPHHGGLSDSRVAVHVLNRWATQCEDRYLAERVVIPLKWSLEHLRRLKQRLAHNGIVSISGEHPGEKSVSVPILGDLEVFATGAPRLARSSGATLLTVYSYRRVAQQYTVVVESPIAVQTTRQPGRDLRSAVEAFAARLEQHVVDHAADWDRWSAFQLHLHRAATR